MYQAGKMDQRVTIQSPASGQDAIGQPATTWTDVVTVWASVAYLSGLSAIKAGADTAQVQASVRIRYRTGVNAGMRVVHGDVVFDIRSVLPVEKNVFLDLVCVATNAAV
jgi:SPP1 family predicted phage head-tail adaptor